MRPNSGSRAYNAKLTEDDVVMMRALRKEGLPCREIREKWDCVVVLQTVYDIVTYKTWRHVA